jgi:tetratricopeptide (TPR) repeat protein
VRRRSLALAGVVFVRCASLLPSQAEVHQGHVSPGGVLEGKAGFARAMEAYDYRRALDVAQAWLKTDPKNEEAALAVAQASNSLADMSTNEAEAIGHVERSIAVLQPLLKASGASSMPTETAAKMHFYYAEALGLQVRAQGTSAIQLLPEIAEHVEAAAKLAPELEDGAPLRLLGTMLVKAPAWPQGPGDADRGMKILQDAMERHPQRAEAYIHYADVLLDASRIQDALRYLARAKDLVGKNPRARKLWLDVDARVKANKKVKQYQ